MRVIRARKKALKIETFAPAEKSISGRVAEFLIWASVKHPREFVTYEEITQAIFTLGKLPRAGSKEVKSISGAVSRARVIMKNRHQRDIVTEVGVGARATVDDLDIMQISVMRDAKAHQGTANKLKSTVGLINDERLNKLIDAAPVEIREDLKVARDWFSEHLKKYVQYLDKPTNARLLLPPMPKSE